MSVKIALADDHALIRNGMVVLLQKLGYEVLFEADNGIDFLEKLKVGPVPDVVLLDINMPEMDGYETALWLKRNHPTIKILVLTMYDDESAILRMIRNGAKGYILKDCHPFELREAILSLMTKGFYQSDLVTGKLIHSINQLDEPRSGDLMEVLGLSQREIEFIKLSCTEMTYKEIADKMMLSPKTIDGYREDLFTKLKLKSRIGLVRFAIKHGIVKL